MILEGAIGDAYGAGFEFVSRDVIEKHNHLERYNKHPSFPDMCGKYTDDTQMSLAIAELIIDGDDFTKENLADRFVDAFKRDPRGGYAGRFYDFLVDIKDGNKY
jgi:ADP-ribosylglycohydrolase